MIWSVNQIELFGFFTDLGILTSPRIFRFYSRFSLTRESRKKKWKTFNTESLGSGKWKKLHTYIHTKSLATNQVYAIVHMRDIWKNVWPKFIKFCMETPCLSPFQEHKYGHRKARETSVFEFSYLGSNGGARSGESTNVAQAQIPASTPYVGWVCCWFSPLLREVFLRVLRFSPLLKNQDFQIPIRPEIR